MPFVFVLTILALIPAGLIMAWLEDGLKKRKTADPEWTIQRAIVRWGNERTGTLKDDEIFAPVRSIESGSGDGFRAMSVHDLMRRQALVSMPSAWSDASVLQRRMNPIGQGRVRLFDSEVALREELFNLRMLDLSHEQRAIESTTILKTRTQTVLDFAPEGALVSVDTRHHGTVRFLRVHNGTVNPDGSREEYAICVPNECRTVKAALAWTYGIEPDAYEEVVRT